MQSDQFQHLHRNALAHDKSFDGLNCLFNPAPILFVFYCFVRCILFKESVQLQHGLALKAVAEGTSDLFHFSKRALDLETIAVQANDVRGSQSQIGTHQNGAAALMNHQHKA